MNRTRILFLSLLSTLFLGASAQAFQLRHIETRDVADANVCGDFNRMAKYQLVLENAEKLPAGDAPLFTESNFAQIANELRKRFDVSPRSTPRVATRKDSAALDSFADPGLSTLEWCYQMDLREAFGFTLKEGAPVAKIEGAMSYARIEALDRSGYATAATVIFDRVRGYLYIHQEW